MNATILITGKRLQSTARSKGIPYEEAVSYERRYGSRFQKRIVYGILIAPEHEAIMNEAIAARTAKRLTPLQKAAAKEKRQQQAITTFTESLLTRFPSMPPREARICAEHATEIGSHRVGRSTTADDPVLAALIAYIRHHHTDYDSLLSDGYNKPEARREVAPIISEYLESWKTPCQTPSCTPN